MAFLLDRWFGLILNQRTSWDAFIVCGLPLCGAVPLDRAGRPRPALARPGGRAAGEGARPTRLSASALSILTWVTTLENSFLTEPVLDEKGIGRTRALEERRESGR